MRIQRILLSRVFGVQRLNPGMVAGFCLAMKFNRPLCLAAAADLN
jgi:hypothetical protein